MTTQPKALRLAEDLPALFDNDVLDADDINDCSDELRRQHALIEELRSSLERISDAWSDAIQSDLENGVRILNDRAASKFAKDFPEISKLGNVINSEYMKHMDDE